MQINKINYMNANVHSSYSQNQNPSFKSIQKNTMVEALAKEGKKLIIFSGPSASGKTTIAEALMKKHPNLFGQIVTCTTRQPREIKKHQNLVDKIVTYITRLLSGKNEREIVKEIDGVDYNFLSVDEFKQQVSDGKFVETCEVYPGKWYGTRVQDIEKAFEKADNVLMLIDVDGARNARKALANKDFTVVPIFLKPESIKVLEKRLKRRGTETPETLNERLARAQYEIECGEKEYPVIIVSRKRVRKNVRNLEKILRINTQA